MSVTSMMRVAGVVMFLLSLSVAFAQEQQSQSLITSKQQATLRANDSAEETKATGDQSSSPMGDPDEAVQLARMAKFVPYCTIITIERGLGWVRGVNYSTFRVGTCDLKSIQSLTAASARAQMATIGIYDSLIISGPYYDTMDVNATQVENPYISLGDLRFSEVSRSEFTLFDALRHPDEAWRWFKEDTAYNPILTTGDVNFIWFAGSKIYVLESKRGEVFVMTGVDHEIAFGQNGIRLRNLGQYLNLPEGWRFRPMRLNRVLSLNSHVLTDTHFKRLIDEFGNLYIQLPTYIDLSQEAALRE